LAFVVLAVFDHLAAFVGLVLDELGNLHYVLPLWCAPVVFVGENEDKEEEWGAGGCEEEGEEKELEKRVEGGIWRGWGG